MPASDLSDDRAWLEAFRRGDEAALERAFRTYAPYVFTILARGARTADSYAPGVRDIETQQDLLHDVFVKAFAERARLAYDGLRPYGPWLAQIARRTLIDHHRKHTSKMARTELTEDFEAFEASTEAWSPGAPLPDAAALSAEERDQVAGFVETLQTGERELVQLRFVEGLSQRDTAEAVDSSRQKIRTLEASIRERFRAFLANWTRP